MADASLSGKTIAVLATDGFEQVELTTPLKALKEAGASVVIVAPEAGDIQGFNHHDNFPLCGFLLKMNDCVGRR